MKYANSSQVISFGVLFSSILLQSFSFLSVKYASLNAGYSLLLLSMAFGFLVFRAYLWQMILRRYELSRVYPFNALVQVLIFLYALFLFDEKMEPNNLIGLILMSLGIILLGKNR